MDYKIKIFLKGVELGPLELEEKNLNKEIDEYLFKIMELEQKWLREQNELVKMVKERERKTQELKSLNDSYVVLTTKKMRIESNFLFRREIKFYTKCLR